MISRYNKESVDHCKTKNIFYLWNICKDYIFLNGYPKEEVYVKEPQGFEIMGHEKKVCMLKNGLYKLKQAPRYWYLIHLEWLLFDSGWISKKQQWHYLAYQNQWARKNSICEFICGWFDINL